MAVYQPTYFEKDSEGRKTGRKLTAGVFWCDFTYKGKRIRESTGQTLKTLAKDYEKRRKRELAEAVAGTKAATAAERIMDLKTAIEDWIVIRTAGKRAKTQAYVRERCAHLIRLLGDKLVCDVVERDVAGYVHTREKEKAVSSSINREVYFLARVLKTDRKAAWPNLGASTQNRERKGKALTEDEVKRLLKAAKANRSRYALPYIAAALYTGFRASEIRFLRWRQVDFIGGYIRSEESKTEGGEYREMPLLPVLAGILAEHRAFVQKRLKAVPEPDHFVFPFSSRGCPVDPTRPVTNIASSWYAIREAAGVTARLHDCRHTFTTRLLESGASETVVREIVGHVDEVVLRRYTHLRRELRDEAVKKAFRGVSDKREANRRVKESPKVQPVDMQKVKRADSAKSLIM